MKRAASGRLLIDPPADGPTNMARDEALLEAVGAGTSPVTLRFYRWSPPTISLGYFQPFSEYARLAPPAGTLPIVRRLTGGGAILHDQEWTYCLALPTGHPLAQAPPAYLYEIVHRAIVEALGAYGVQASLRTRTPAEPRARRAAFFCFARASAYDIVLSGAKVAGSAQRRRHDGVMQHGSLILASRFEQHPVGRLPAEITRATSELIGRITTALGQQCQITWNPGRWSRQELQTAAELRAKYASQAWTQRR